MINEPKMKYPNYDKNDYDEVLLSEKEAVNEVQWLLIAYCAHFYAINKNTWKQNTREGFRNDQKSEKPVQILHEAMKCG